MQRQNAGAFRLQSVRWFHIIQITFGAVLLMAASSHAGVLMASWTAPTTNTDGSALTDLSYYRIYYGTSNSPCRDGAFFVVASPTPMPQPNQAQSFQLTGLTTASIYNVSITAVNTGGNESFCSEIASAIARDDSTGIATGQDHSATGFVTTPTDQSVHGSVATPTVQDHTIINSAPAPTVEDHSAINPPQQANPVTAPTH
ncbi:MAG TPA: fibronectin type III domain-containing protein [Methylomirabilota bacterium]|nr:fibronectin type III domain-containing protein [Methylomirabilota bacterium]